MRYHPLVPSFTQTYQCDTPFCNISRDTCAIPRKTSTKKLCDTIAESIARYEEYRCWASKLGREKEKERKKERKKETESSFLMTEGVYWRHAPVSPTLKLSSRAWSRSHIGHKPYNPHKSYDEHHQRNPVGYLAAFLVLRLHTWCVFGVPYSTPPTIVCSLERHASIAERACLCSSGPKFIAASMVPLRWILSVWFIVDVRPLACTGVRLYNTHKKKSPLLNSITPDRVASPIAEYTAAWSPLDHVEK